MRTTFSPDPDVEAKIKVLVRSSNKSMNRVLNELLRQALGGDGSLVHRQRFEVKPFDLGLQAGIDPLRLNQIVDDLEDEQVIQQMARDRGHT